MTPPGRGSPRESLAAGAAALLAYLGTLSAQYNFDGVMYAFWLTQARERGHFGGSAHPHHVLYAPVAYAFSVVAGALGVDGPQVLVLALLNALLGATLVALVVHLVRALTGDRAVSFAAGVAYGATFGVWFFAVEAEVYLLEALLLAIPLVVVERWTRTGGEATPARAAGLGAMAVGVVGGHITCGLAWPAIAHVAGRGSGPWRPVSWAGTCVFGAVAVGGTAAMYALVYVTEPWATAQPFLTWLLGSANPTTERGYAYSYWMLSLDAIPRGLEGLSRVLLAGGVYRLEDGAGLAALRAIVLLGLGAGVAGYVAALRRMYAQRPAMHWVLVLLVVPRGIFTFLWEPHNFEIKVALLFPLVVMAAWALAYARQTAPRYRGTLLAAAWVTAGALLAHNFAASLGPGADPERNADLQRAYFIRDHTEPTATVYIAGSQAGYNTGKAYVLYFARRQVRIADFVLGQAPFPGALAGVLAYDAAHGQPSYVLGELLEDGEGLRALATHHGLKVDDVIAFFRSRSPALVARMPDGFALYRVH